ncbi:MAG: hypothetical protein LBF87_06560 [Treponema sp.]|jgi:subtilisin family serine protease|nr:hypothetical protein [Treponema sp.]
MEDKIKIAIIDSGIRLDHPAFAGKTPVVIDTVPSVDGDLYGHGTAVYNIIRKVEADITNFKLPWREDGIEETCLLELLNKIDREYPVDI